MTILAYLDRLASDTRRKRSTVAGWRTACRRFARMMGDVEVEEITKAMVNEWAGTLDREDIAANTANAYMRQVRSVFNKAVDEFGLDCGNPFSTAMIKERPTVKRALLPAQIRKMAALEGLTKLERKARDIFMLIIRLRGIAPCDLWGLRPRDVSDGCVTYCRLKTGGMIRFRLDHDEEAMMRRLGFADGTERNFRAESQQVNRQLKKIGQRLGLRFSLTLYCARHSWATAAKAAGVSRSDIGQMMGHRSEKTTEKYLATIETPFLDVCHSRTMAHIMGVG